VMAVDVRLCGKIFVIKSDDVSDIDLITRVKKL
jgi:hypothetical protein